MDLIPAKQRSFLTRYTGKCKGRYHIAYLTILGIAGGEELKKQAMAKVGRDNYLPDKMYPLKEAVNIILHGMEHGIPAERMGRMVAQSYKRTAPELLHDLDHNKVIDLLLFAYSSETDVGQMLSLKVREPGRVVVARRDSAQPCGFFLGVLKGGFEIADLKAQVKEIECQWCEDKSRCLYEVTWDV